jgi:hypothetical protein
MRSLYASLAKKTFRYNQLKTCSNHVTVSIVDSVYNKTCDKVHVGVFHFHALTALSGPGPPHDRGFTMTLRHTTLGRTTLDGWSACRRDLYLTTNNTHKRQTSMPPAGFEPTIPASERPQTHALDGAATGIDITNKQLRTLCTGYVGLWVLYDYITFKIIR